MERTMAHGNHDGATLKKGLRQRHLAMIAIGGVIGAGLFVGSGAIIGEVGPAAFITYAITGVLIVMVMRMLGEMAVANPSTGSFRRLRPAGPGRLGRVQRRLAVLVLLGYRGRLRGGGRGEDPATLAAGRAAVV